MFQDNGDYNQMDQNQINSALQLVHDISTDSRGEICVTEQFRVLKVPIFTFRYESTRQRADMATLLLLDMGLTHHEGLQDAIARNIIMADRSIIAARVVAVNASNGLISYCAWWERSPPTNLPRKESDTAPKINTKPDPNYPWYVRR